MYRKDSFITHRAFCDALAEESARLSAHQLISTNINHHHHHINPAPTPHHHYHNQSLLVQQNPQTNNISPSPTPSPFFHVPSHHHLTTTTTWDSLHSIKPESPALLLPSHHKGLITSSPFQNLQNPATANPPPSAASHSLHLSATALLQKAASVGAVQAAVGGDHRSQMSQLDLSELAAVSGDIAGHSSSSSSPSASYNMGSLATWQQKSDSLTRDFLGLTHQRHHAGNGNGSGANGGVGVNVSMNVREMLTCTGGAVGFQQYNERDHSTPTSSSSLLLKAHGHGFGFPPPPPAASGAWGDCQRMA